MSRVFLVTRHGDRSPGKNMFAGYSEESAEEEAWNLVAADRQRDKELKHLEVAFPVHNVNPETLDFRTAPFGVLTGKGFDQLSQVGKMYSDLYADFIDPSLTYVRASNYRRTQQSGQALLGSLFGIESEAVVPIQVHDEKQCALQPYEGMPELLQGARDMEDLPFFVDKERSVSSLKKLLTTNMPLFMDDKPFQWINAGDQLFCRRAHMKNEAVTALGDHRLHSLLTDHVRMRTLRQVSWRFGTWYHNPLLLNMAIGHLLLEIAETMACILDRGDPLREHLNSSAISLFPDQKGHLQTLAKKKNMFVFMGHDVTVCPLLVALGIWDKTWPDYAATVAIELYAPGESASTGAPYPYHAVSVLYNGEPMQVPGSFEGNGRWLLPLDIFFGRVAKINAGSVLSDGSVGA